MHLSVGFKDGTASLIPVTNHTEVRLVEDGRIVESFSIDGVASVTLDQGSVQPVAKVETVAAVEAVDKPELAEAPAETAPEDVQAPSGPVTAEELENDLTREELDHLAVEAGVQDPGALPNKAAVAEAIVAKHAETAS